MFTPLLTTKTTKTKKTEQIKEINMDAMPQYEIA